MDREAWRTWYEETYLHTEHWHKVQRVVYGRNEGKCERCRENDIEHIHHNHYFSLWHELDDDPGSVMGICRQCHLFVHGHSTYDPLASPPNEDPPTPEPPPCVECGWDAQTITEGEEEPICWDCMRQRCEPD